MKKILFFICTALFLFLIISTLILLQIFLDTNQKGFLEVIFLDVGQGDSVFIETPSGFQMIIDAGPNSKVVRELSNFLPFYDRKIDLLLATHSDSDHVAGFVEILNRFKVNGYSQNYFLDEDSLNTEIYKSIDEDKIDQYFLKSGHKIILDKEENIYLEVLWPPENHIEKDNNDNSIITRIVYGDSKIMLTGDASIEIEEKLIQNLNTEQNLQSNILKLGHHGSKTSTSLDFLQNVNPDFVIVSAGKDNRFGHPHQEVLDNVQKISQNLNKQIKILETSSLGSIHFRSNGSEVWLID